jgi:hypothetical protein
MTTKAKVTKAELVRQIKAKASKASPLAKRVFFRGLERNTKAELMRKLSRMRVTRNGDIDLR